MDGLAPGGYQAGASPPQGPVPTGEEYDSEDYDEEEGEEEECPEDCCKGTDHEKNHFLDVCYSFMLYEEGALEDVELIEEAVRGLDADDLAMWPEDPNKWISAIHAAIKVNAKFLAMLPVAEVSAVQWGPDAEAIVRTVPPHHKVAPSNLSKVSSTLRQFVRDWAPEGREERRASYDVLVKGLLKRMPATDSKGVRLRNGQGFEGAPKVLCPGSGLGRLPFDLARMGYDAQGNEFSYQMLLGSHLILNRCMEPNAFTIYPFVNCSSSRTNKYDHLRPIRIPEVCPLRSLPPNAAFSMSAGEFVDVYKDQANQWDACLTAFFIDTAKNIFMYIRTLAEIIREGGWWLNLGPLLFHYAQQPGDISIELSWEEVRPAIEKYFDIEEEEFHHASYTTKPEPLHAVKYRCIYFVAKRNGEPVTGESHPAFNVPKAEVDHSSDDDVMDESN